MALPAGRIEATSNSACCEISGPHRNKARIGGLILTSDLTACLRARLRSKTRPSGSVSRFGKRSSGQSISVRYDRKMGLWALSPRGLLPTNLTLFSCLLQLPIPLSRDLLLTAGEPVLRCDIANGTVQADIVAVFHIALHQPPRVLQRQRRPRPDALLIRDLCQR